MGYATARVVCSLLLLRDTLNKVRLANAASAEDLGFANETVTRDDGMTKFFSVMGWS